MKMKQHAVAFALVAVMAGTAGAAVGNGTPVVTNAHVGYYVAKKAVEKANLDQESKEALVECTTAAGAIAGALLGTKVGAVAGPVGAAVGAFVGAM